MNEWLVWSTLAVALTALIWSVRRVQRFRYLRRQELMFAAERRALKHQQDFGRNQAISAFRNDSLTALSFVIGIVGIVLAVALFALQERSHSSAAHTSPTTTPSPSPGTAAAIAPSASSQMSTLAGDLTLSGSVRSSVQNAISNVESCSGDQINALTTIQQAISTRQRIIESLSTVNLSNIPTGTQMMSTLTQALNYSIQADEDYSRWIQDMVSSGKCQAASQDGNFEDGENASRQADAAKSSFVAIWNTIAPGYGEPTYTAANI